MTFISWKLAIAILITAPILGKLLDAAFHRSYNPKLKEWLFKKAIRFDEYTYIKLLHYNMQRGLKILTRYFGKAIFSWKLAIISFVFPSVFYLISFSEKGIDIYYIYSFLDLIIVNVITVQISLLATKYFLRLAKPKIGALLLLLFVDIAVSYLLGPLPAVVSVAQADFNIPILIYGWLTYLFTAHKSEYSVEAYIMFFLACLPSLFHILMIIYDILYKIVMRPLLIFCSGLLEFLSNEKQPITWILSVIGAIPAVLKAWSEIF